MFRWTDEELRELVTLWPTSTAAQIAYRLRRPRAAVCGKVQRLLREGLLESKNAKHPNSRKRRPRRASPPQVRIMPPPQVDDSLAMQPCSILELDQTRCHWPLGDIEAVAVLFCGGVAVPGRCCCAHHLWIARGQGSASKRSAFSSASARARDRSFASICFRP